MTEHREALLDLTRQMPDLTPHMLDPTPERIVSA
jgi:hypothetical protein